MRIYIQIAINNPSERTPTIILHSANQKYVFNCAENFMRFQKYHKIKCPQAMNFFFTRLSSETMDGLHPNVTNLFGTGMAIGDRIFGPSNTVQMFQAMKTKYYIKLLPFSVLGFQPRESLVASTENYLLGINDMDKIFQLQSNKEFPLHYFESSASANSFISTVFQSDALNRKDFFNDARNSINSTGNFQDKEVEIVPIFVRQDNTLAYLLKFPKPPNKMNREKLNALKIPGPLMKQFQKDGKIEINGRIITLEEVSEPEQRAIQILIFDCVSLECLNSVSLNESKADLSLYAVIHLASISLLKTEEYHQFLKTFNPDCLHIFMNAHLSQKSDTQLASYIQFNHIFANNTIAEIFPQNFPLISSAQLTDKSDIDELFHFLPCKMIAKQNYELVLHPRSEEKYSLIRFQGIEKKIPLLIQQFESAANETNDYIKSVLQMDDSFQKLSNVMREKTSQFDPHIYFLGTTCMMPTTYRNNSSILLYEKQRKQAIMFDCGEGTYYQMLNQFGEEECQQVLKNLQIIVITHAHSDHYMGFQGVIYQRQIILENLKKSDPNYSQDHTLYLLLPWCLAPWFAALDTYSESMNCKVIYIQDYNGNSYQELPQEYKKDEFNDEELKLLSANSQQTQQQQELFPFIVQ